MGLGFLIPILACLLLSCSYRKEAELPFQDAEGASLSLTALTRESQRGVVTLDRGKSLEYDAQGVGVQGLSLELCYRITGQSDFQRFAPVLRMDGEDAWLLPTNGAFLGIQRNIETFRYRIPLGGASLGLFFISMETSAPDKAQKDQPKQEFHLLELRLVPRWFGYTLKDSELLASPFVSLETSSQRFGMKIDPPDRYKSTDPVEITFNDVGENQSITLGTMEYTYRPPGIRPASIQVLPVGALAENPYPIKLSGTLLPNNLFLAAVPRRFFPRDPIPADPALILYYRTSAWRDPRYEVFSWDRFPSILIFDTADYAVQDKLFKRLAFFVEKAGFRGRIPEEREIAQLHGWNAHDYRAQDLAAFFDLAQSTGVSLTREESELREILLTAGILKAQDGQKGPFMPGEGAIISLSRESEGYLRSLFMVHEAFHGLFFIHQDFQDFALHRWLTLDRTAREFLIAYFDSRRYDTEDNYLMKNELMAYCLQQPVSLAGAYFGSTLAQRVNADSTRRKVLPPQDGATGTWPLLADLYTQEAEAFSSYVKGKWDIAAGRVWTYYKTKNP